MNESFWDALQVCKLILKFITMTICMVQRLSTAVMSFLRSRKTVRKRSKLLLRKTGWLADGRPEYNYKVAGVKWLFVHECFDMQALRGKITNCQWQLARYTAWHCPVLDEQNTKHRKSYNIRTATPCIVTCQTVSLQVYESKERHTSAGFKMAVFCEAAPLSLVDSDRRFGGTSFLHICQYIVRQNRKTTITTTGSNVLYNLELRAFLQKHDVYNNFTKVATRLAPRICCSQL